MILTARKSTYLFILFVICTAIVSCAQETKSSYKILTGADQTNLYVSKLKGKRIAIVANQTSVISNGSNYTHLVGKKLQLQTLVDGVGNVIITKPATKGFENKKTIVMQSHLDMVHQKNSETVFNFETEGIKMHINGDWVTADGTTLGADNGLGVATIMAILSSDDIKHPAIEALFTIDEETGMTGAMGLEGGILTGEILLNLDTEEDDEIDMGCAGGIDVTATRRYIEEATPQNTTAFKIAIKGLQGGHSGMDIHKGFGNANKICKCFE